MRFWDSSAIVPLIVSESWSELSNQLLRTDPEIVVWWGTEIECFSALRRRERDGLLDVGAVREAASLLGALASEWSEVLPTQEVRAHAERALAVHPLHAADALQLGAALTWRRDPAERPHFVCVDQGLWDAAAREGFELLPPDAP